MILDGLKQDFAETSRKRKVDEEGFEKVKRMKTEVATSNLTNRLKNLTIEDLNVCLKSLISTLKFNKGLVIGSYKFEMLIAAYRRQLHLSVGVLGKTSHLRELIWQFLFVKEWYGKNIRFGANTSKLT